MVSHSACCGSVHLWLIYYALLCTQVHYWGVADTTYKIMLVLRCYQNKTKNTTWEEFNQDRRLYDIEIALNSPLTVTTCRFNQ